MTLDPPAAAPAAQSRGWARSLPRPAGAIQALWRHQSTAAVAPAWQSRVFGRRTPAGPTLAQCALRAAILAGRPELELTSSTGRSSMKRKHQRQNDPIVQLKQPSSSTEPVAPANCPAEAIRGEQLHRRFLTPFSPKLRPRMRRFGFQERCAIKPASQSIESGQAGDLRAKRQRRFGVTSSATPRSPLARQRGWRTPS